MRGLLLVVVFLSGCTSPWVHKDYGKVRRGDERLEADWAECQHSRPCMKEKGWTFTDRRRRGEGTVEWVNPDIPPEQAERRFRIDQARCRTAALTAPVMGGSDLALLLSLQREQEILKTCLEGYGWEQK